MVSRAAAALASALTCAACVVGAGCGGRAEPERRWLVFYWQPLTRDTVSAAAPQSLQDASRWRYWKLRVEGRVYAEQAKATAALKLYRKGFDHVTLATAESERTAQASGYEFVRVEGSIFTSPRPGTAPLKLFYSQALLHSLTTASPAGEAVARAAGYEFVRVEGYVERPPGSG